LWQGQTLGRYGEISAKSNYVTLPGSSPNNLSLPPNTNPSVYSEIQIIKPIHGVTQSTIAPWGGTAGGGIQYQLPDTLLNLESSGYIHIIR
jgi:hypothetical protein